MIVVKTSGVPTGRMHVQVQGFLRRRANLVGLPTSTPPPLSCWAGDSGFRGCANGAQSWRNGASAPRAVDLRGSGNGDRFRRTGRGTPRRTPCRRACSAL
eukprot:356922-Chlamydomonas_euryale.AAC.4